MRRKIAVFSNGWGSEYLQQVGEGIWKRAKEANTDVFAFVHFSTHSGRPAENNGETSILRLPDLREFDGAVLLTNSFNQQAEFDYLAERIAQTKIPAVSLQCPMDGAVFMETDNYSGAYEMTSHMIIEHNIGRIVFIGGYEEHEECRIRLKAVKDAAQNCGAPLREEDIYFGDWSAESAKVCIKECLRRNPQLPDAVICANDLMAIAVCEYFMEHDISVPQQVKVTGYDCLRQAQEHCPSITTVTQEWTTMGEKAVDILLDLIEGKETPQKISIRTKVVYGESCGCGLVGEKGAPERGRNQGISTHRLDGMTIDQHFRHLYMAVRKDKSIEDLHTSLSHFFEQEGFMEGENFSLSLNPKFFTEPEDEDALKTVGFPEKMDVVCAMKDGCAKPYETLSLKEALFAASNEHSEPGIYVCVPLHSENTLFGYAMLSRNLNIASSNLLYIWTRHVIQYLEQVRSNVQISELNRKLEALSVTDALTNVYNRTGCERILFPFLKKTQEEGRQGILMIADLDRLKIINDRRGHAYGDIALRLVAQAMRKSIPEDFYVGRFGGDEFVIVGESRDGITVEKLEAEIERQVETDQRKADISFPISVSIGGILLEKGKAFALQESLQLADIRMYAVKAIHHESME